jgi:glutamine amidotransferase
VNNREVSIINTGLSNIASVSRMVEKIGGNPIICSSPNTIDYNGKIILPGVGKFDSGVSALIDKGFDKSFWDRIINNNNPVLGICLGMQLLCRSSEEGSKEGLSLIDADVKKMESSKYMNIKIPHMGWNDVEVSRSNPLLDINEKKDRFYFVHSYMVVPDSNDITIGKTVHGIEFCSAFQHKNLFGVQFHPEKSHSFGMRLFKNFLDL